MIIYTEDNSCSPFRSASYKSASNQKTGSIRAKTPKRDSQPSRETKKVKKKCTTAGVQADADAEIKFVSNFASFLFSDVRYELNGVEIDSVRNVGRASLMKLMIASRMSHLSGYASFCKAFESTSPRRANGQSIVYDVVIPLSVWFLFCDDYRKIILNCKHELILNRSRQSLDCTAGGGAAATAAVVSIALRKIEWKMPHITLSDQLKLNMLNYLTKNRKITVQHRSMDMMELPQLPATTSHVWSVKTVSNLNKPRYVVVGLQTGRNARRVENVSKFDSCYVSDVRLHLNSQIFPYNINALDIGGGLFAELYNSYASIQSSYYNSTETINPFNINNGVFQASPLFAFDTSRADESLIGGAVDIRVEIKTQQNIPANTTAYCLIIYDNEFTYSPFDGIVVRNV
ncbi:uncharacterized protein LOC116348084 [Contarinia nasturtii]|uniref:uncharacterized protein LOC116348084 n=1 Tax=Contarinia nasturtii TaxID=265458 RepID=UPI0012D453D0|nr:uncharacterized protein LOC116348084 [Contarinia nasturtii]